VGQLRRVGGTGVGTWTLESAGPLMALWGETGSVKAWEFWTGPFRGLLSDAGVFDMRRQCGFASLKGHQGQLGVLAIPFTQCTSAATKPTCPCTAAKDCPRACPLSALQCEKHVRVEIRILPSLPRVSQLHVSRLRRCRIIIHLRSPVHPSQTSTSLARIPRAFYTRSE
jgi:hypothetical protein